MNIPILSKSRKVLALAISLGLLTSLVGTAPSAMAVATLTVTYDANGATGTVPVNSTLYSSGDSVPVAGQNGLTKNGSTFGGWSYDRGAFGTSIVSGSFTIAGNATLIAVWNAATYSVTYNGNGNTGGAAPQPTIGAGSANLAISSSLLVKSGSIFAGWNTLASGTGTPYVVASNYALFADVNLYAVWSAGNPVYTITYTGNSNTGGAVPSPTVGLD